MLTKVLICKIIGDGPAYCPDRYELFQIFTPCKNSHCFQKVVQLFNLMRDYLSIRDCNWLECVKKCFKRRNSTALSKFSFFFEHMLILIKFLAPCMFKLTNVYYINLILVMLPSRCFLFKVFLRFSKLSSIKLRSIYMFN